MPEAEISAADLDRAAAGMADYDFGFNRPRSCSEFNAGHQYDDSIGAKQLICTDPGIASSGGGVEDAYNIDLNSEARIVTGQITTGSHGGTLGSGNPLVTDGGDFQTFKGAPQWLQLKFRINRQRSHSYS